MVTAANDEFDYISEDTLDRPVNLGRAARLLQIVLQVSAVLMLILLVFFAGFFAVFTLNGAGLSIALDSSTYTPQACKILAMITAYYMAGIAVVLAVILQLRKIVRSLNSGDPFVPDNARHLRRIWVIIAAGELARTVFDPWIEKSILALSDMGLPLDLPATEAAGLNLDIRLHVWFFVLILIVLAQVFREGARLRADARLTV